MKKKVLIMSLEKGYGGIENEVITLANSLVSLYDIELLFLNDINDSKDINSKIKVSIHSKKVVGESKFYKELLSNTDVVISTNYIFNKYILKYSKGKKIYWEHEITNDMKKLEELKKFDELVVPSREIYDIYSKLNDHVDIINNAINITDKASDLKSNNIVFLGKLKSEKRIDDLIEVMDLVNESIDVNLFIIGEGSERAYLEGLIKSKNMKNIKFLGSMDKDEIEKVYLNSSLFCTCSERESFGLSILEAMSYGIPVVAFSDVPTLKLIILDDINGYLVDNRDKYIMKNKIVKLMTDQMLRQTLGNCAKEKVLEYDINSIKREWIKLI